MKRKTDSPEAVPEEAATDRGDRATAPPRASGEASGEPCDRFEGDDAFQRCLKEIAGRAPLSAGPFAGRTTDEIMRILRGDD